MPNEKESPLTLQFKPKLGTNGLFVLQTRIERIPGVEQEHTILTLRPSQAIALGSVLLSEGKKHAVHPEPQANQN